MKWVALAGLMSLTACANALGNDAACSATREARSDLAGALVDDGGSESQRAGLELIETLDAVCVDT